MSSNKVNLFEPDKIKSFRALKNYVIVTEMNFEEKLSHGGIIIPSTDGKLEGIHARWGRVYAVGPTQQDVKVGQYVCVSHGRWTRGLDIEDIDGKKTIRRIDTKDILLVSDTPVRDEMIGKSL
jgi:co-chaperonin GroES (HSP10)